MTRREADSTAAAAAIRFGKPFVIYRLPAWPADSFGVVALDRGLPPQAEVAAQCDPFAPAPASPADDSQGSLF